jgi:hypothetical protein
VAFRTKARVRLARRDGHDDFSTCVLIEVCRSPFDFPKDWLKCYPISTPFRTRAGCEPARRGRTSGVGCDGQFKVNPPKLRMRRFCIHVCAKSNPGDRTRGFGTRNTRYFNVQDLGTALADRQLHQPNAGVPCVGLIFVAKRGGRLRLVAKLKSPLPSPRYCSITAPSRF